MGDIRAPKGARLPHSPHHGGYHGLAATRPWGEDIMDDAVKNKALNPIAIEEDASLL